MIANPDWLDLAGRHCFRTRLDGELNANLVLARAEGSFVWDTAGNNYIDFNAGQLCSIFGHNHPRIVQALTDASQSMLHASSNYFNTFEIALAEKLAGTLPQPLTKSLFALSGSEATEAAILLAKVVTGRYEVASPHVSFHGLSDSPRSLTYAGWRHALPPQAPGAFAFFAPYCFRCPLRLTYPDCDLACLHSSAELLDAEAIESLAAFITEPLFSAGGVIEPPLGWLPALRQKADERGALLILDESQTALGKLGTMWAFEREAVVPDVLIVSKHFGGGVAISAVITSSEIESAAVERGFLYSHSHSSDPLGCAAALASLDIIAEEGILEKALWIEQLWKALVEDMSKDHYLIGDIRGRGVLHGIELQPSEREPGFSIGHRISQHCESLGLLFSVRQSGSVLRFTIPFSSTESVITRASEILASAFEAVERELGAGASS